MDNAGDGSPATPRTIAELIARIQEERAALEAVIRSLTPAELVRPGQGNRIFQLQASAG